MDRQIIYPGAIPMDTDLLSTNRNTMVAIAKLAAAMFGTSTVVNGLQAIPTAPAGLTVNVTQGEIYSLASLEATAYSSLPADNARQVLKQGISLDVVNLSCPAPSTAGFSINYLVQAAFQESDSGSAVLPYYNAGNPTSAWSGPNNSGTPQATIRKGIVTLSAKAGVAATTGSQTTPAADAGYTGLWVVTVANGQTQITAPNIVQATNAPILPTDLLHAIQASSLIVGTDTGAANASVVSYSPPVTALKDGMVLWFKAAAANTGAATLNVNGLGVQPVVGLNQTALQGGEIVLNGKCQVVWNATISSFVLIECTGGALQVSPGAQSNHAPNLGQFLAVLSANGYLKIPVMVGGVLRTLILQWATSNASIPSGTQTTIVTTWPIAFPNACFGVTQRHQAAITNSNTFVTSDPNGLTGAITYVNTTTAQQVYVTLFSIGW